MKARLEEVHARVAPALGRLALLLASSRGTRRDLVEVAEALEDGARRLRDLAKY